MTQSPDFLIVATNLPSLARGMTANSAKWTHRISNQELRALYNILSTMLHDVHPNAGNMLALEAILEKVPEGREWWAKVKEVCDGRKP